MRYHFTRVWAYFLVVAGVVLMVAGTVSALAVSVIGLPPAVLARFPSGEVVLVLRDMTDRRRWEVAAGDAPMARYIAKLTSGLIAGKADGMAFLQELVP